MWRFWPAKNQLRPHKFVDGGYRVIRAIPCAAVDESAKRVLTGSSARGGKPPFSPLVKTLASQKPTAPSFRGAFTTRGCDLSLLSVSTFSPRKKFLKVPISSLQGRKKGWVNAFVDDRVECLRVKSLPLPPQTS